MPPILCFGSFVILSGVAASRGEAAAKSKDPYLTPDAPCLGFPSRYVKKQALQSVESCQGLFDSVSPFVNRTD